MVTAPKGWKTKPIGQLLDVQNGYAFASEQFSQSSGKPLIRIRDLKNGHQTEINYQGEYDEKFVVHAGDLLIGMDGEFRCYQWKGIDALLNQRVCRLVDFADEIIPEFVLFGVNSHLKVIEENTPFVTVRHLSAKKVKAIDFAYPSTDEQHRIVAHIKECMERVEEIEGLRAETVSEAEATLPSLLNESFLDLFENYDMAEIGDMTAETRYGTSRKCSTTPKGAPILRIPNVAGGFVNFNNLKYCSLDAKEHQKLSLQKGDLLFVRTNGSRDLVGRCAIYEGNGTNQSHGFASYLIRVRLNQDKMRPHFLAFFLNSTHGRSELDKRRRTSAGQFNINSENLRNIKVPSPPIEIQDKIIESLKDHQTKVTLLQNEIQAAQESELHLRESILRKAFAGEL